MLYEWVKFLHIFLIVIAGGTSAASGIWLEFATRAPGHEQHILAFVRRLNDRLVLPGFLLVFIAGASLVAIGNWPWTSPWLLAAIAAWAAVVAAVILSGRLITRQLRILDHEGRDSLAYRRAGVVTRLVGAFVGLAFLAALYLMVAKPY